jgi:membrane peptidoglycan carboxypeptidase
LALALTELLTPAVGDAPARVTALDAAHHSHPFDIAATDRIAMATVAVEDERFYSHHGIDTLGIVRAAWGGTTGTDLGGSTIDQQLAKTLYTNGDTGVLSRLSQAGIALKLEGHYTKTAILSMYLDAINYGHGYYGIAAAAPGTSAYPRRS